MTSGSVHQKSSKARHQSVVHKLVFAVFRSLISLRLYVGVFVVLSQSPIPNFFSDPMINSAWAQSKPKPIDPKRLKDSLNAGEAAIYGFSLSSALDKIIADSANTDLYDPITIQSLRRLRDEAQPRYLLDDVDPELTRRVAEKALAIQSGRSLSSLLAGSELKSTYRQLLTSLDTLQNTFKYSLQDAGGDLKFSRVSKGKKLLELKLEFNLKQGVDPQVRLGNNFRLRYDYLDRTPMFEYGFSF